MLKLLFALYFSIFFSLISVTNHQKKSFDNFLVLAKLPIVIATFLTIKTYITPPSERLEYRLEGGVTDVCSNGLGDGYINIQNQVLGEIKISKNIKYSLLQAFLEKSIQNEVHRTFRRLKPIFNTWLIILLMLSTSGVVGVLLLLGKLAKEMEVYSQELDGIKYDALSQLNYIAADAEKVLSEIKEKLKIANK